MERYVQVAIPLLVTLEVRPDGEYLDRIELDGEYDSIEVTEASTGEALDFPSAVNTALREIGL